jgi:hypothetical protein
MRRPIPDLDYSEDDREQIMVVYYGTASLKAGGRNRADVGVISPLIAKGARPTGGLPLAV